MDNSKENRMGTMPVGKLLFRMSVPAICSMMVLALYNIVDSIFVSRVSETALTAVSLSFPLQQLLTSFAVGLAIGVCSVISRRLGEGNTDRAESAAQTGYTITMVSVVLFIIIGIFLTKPFLKLYADGNEVYDMAVSYLSIVLIADLGAFISTFTEKVLQGTGDTLHPMIIQMSGCVFNIIFDPILIFGLFGFPEMGVTGAAVATVAGQFFAAVVGIVFINKNRYIHIDFKKLFYDGNSAKEIYRVGFPAVIMQGIGTVMTSLMNAILIVYDIVATTVFGVFFKLQSFVFMPIFGMNQGLMPIVGYNYGAGNKERMMQALKLALVYAIVIMTCGMLIFTLFPHVLLGLFNASDKMLEIGCTALRRISMSFPLAAITIILGAVFQAVGDGYLSMLTSIVRQIVFLIPLAYILGRVSGLSSVWYAYILAEIIAVVLNLFFWKFENSKINAQCTQN